MDSSEASQPSSRRDLRHAARHYLGTWRVWLIVCAVALIAGIGFSWNWFVAIGLAPILLAALPCLLMCGLGLCVVCSPKMRSR